jgi:hypothetical protein
MPILECRCGMVMSVQAENPRATCIRCGGASFGRVDPPGVRRGEIYTCQQVCAATDAYPLVLHMGGEATVHVTSGV